jgi:hypothetical protein
MDEITIQITTTATRENPPRAYVPRNMAAMGTKSTRGLSRSGWAADDDDDDDMAACDTVPCPDRAPPRARQNASPARPSKGATSVPAPSAYLPV